MQIFDLAFRVRLNSQDILHKKRLLKELELEGNTNLSLEEINVSTLIDDEKRKIISLVISLEDSGKNFKKSLQNYQENVVLDDDNDKSMLFNDINELLSHWHNYAKNTENTTLHQFKNSMSLGQTHPLTQHSGVTLSTIHTMKGQEFDIVFIIGMDDETFPDYRAIRNNGVEMLQEKNNLYVAFTRSKRWLYVTWPENRTMPWGDIKSRKVSRFLDGFTPENNL
jgi:DNA helicase-2/ATP-dependent DNA helicase PcrA